MIAFFVVILIGLLFYGIIRYLPSIATGLGIIAMSPFLALKEGVEWISQKKDKSQFRYLPVFITISKAILLWAFVILFFPVINTYGTFKRGKRELGILLIFACLLTYSAAALVIYLEYFYNA